MIALGPQAPPRPRRQRILSVINQKGGVGKTTIAVHLALAAVDAGLSTLLIDFDSQGSASVVLTRDLSISDTPGGAETLFTDPEALAPIETGSRIDLLHGQQHLDRIDRGVDLNDVPALQLAVRALPYDVVVIDTPPAPGARQWAALLWSEIALMPLEPNFSSLHGLKQTKRSMRTARRLNPRIASRHAINRFDRRSSAQKSFTKKLERRIPLMKPYLTLRVHVGEALDHGVPVWRYAKARPDLRKMWRDFCRELLS